MNSKRLINRKIILAAAISGLSGFGLVNSLRADTYTWSATSGTWTAAGAWSGMTWADGGDALFTNTANATATLTLAASANSLTTQAGSGISVTIGGLGTLSLGPGGLSTGSAGVFSNTLTINAPLTLTASQTWNNQNGGGMTVAGPVDFGSGTLTIASQGNVAIAISNAGNNNGALNAGSGNIVIAGNGFTPAIAAGSNTAFGNTTIYLQGRSRIDGNDVGSLRTITNNIFVDAGTSVPNFGGQGNVGPLLYTGNLTFSSNATGLSTIQLDTGGSANQNQVNTFAGTTLLQQNLSMNVVGNANSLDTTIFATPITDDGNSRNVIKNGNGAGLLVFAANNTFGGTTSVNNGTLQIGTGGTTGSFGLGAVTVGGNAASNISFNRSDTYTVANAISGSGSIYQNGSGTTVFGNTAVTNTGTLGVNRGTVEIDFTQPNNTATSNILANTNLALAGGALHMNATAANTQTFANTFVNNGASSVGATLTDAGASLALNNITRNIGGSVDFNLPANGFITTTSSNATPTILGGYATVGGNTWASVDGSGHIVGLSSYSGDVNSNGLDVDVPSGAVSTVGGNTVNSLRFNAGDADTTLNLGGDLNVSSGGILITPAVGSHAITINNNNLNNSNPAGNDLVVIQNATNVTTINSSIPSGGLTKAGVGTLVLAGNNGFNQGLRVNGGTVSVGADSNLGNSSGSITLNGGALQYTGTGSISTWGHALSIGTNGGTIDLLHSFNDGNGDKIQISANASFFNGGATTGPINLTGHGILAVSNPGTPTAQAYHGAWNLYGSVLELQYANGAGGNEVPITIHPGGELAIKGVNVPNPVKLNGGILGVDSSAATTAGGPVSVLADSKIRLGNFFGPGNRNLIIGGPLSGSGNLSLIESPSVSPSDGNLDPTPSAPSGATLVLSGDNGYYTGTLDVTGGHNIQFANFNSYLAHLNVSSSATALVGVGIGTVGATIGNNFPLPTFTQDPGSTGDGVILYNGGAYSRPIDLSTLYGGKWFLGAGSTAASQAGSVFSAITPGTDDAGNRVYRLGGGAGSLFLGAAGQLKDFDTGSGTLATNVLIGDPRINGGGTVRYGAAMTYTGSTTIANGTLLLNFGDNFTPAATQVFFGTATSSGTLDLAGHSTTVGGLNVVAGADPTRQIIGNSGTGTLAVDSTLTVNTDAGSSNFAGIIKDGIGSGANKVKLVVSGTTNANSVTLSGDNTYTGTTTITGGKLVLANNAKNPVLSGGGGADIQGGRLILDYNDTGVAPDVKSILTAGYGQTPKFSSGQIRTSNAEDPAKGLGWADNTAAKQETIAYTWYGDANVDGQVDVTDLGALATNWQTNNVWAGGDFNYDGFVDVTDLGALATNWQAGVGSPLGRGSLEAAMAAVGLGGVSVPEPATMGLIVLAAWSLKRSRRRN